MKKLIIAAAVCCAMASVSSYAAPSSQAAAISNYKVTFPQSVLGTGATQFTINLAFTAPNCDPTYYTSCTSFNGFTPIFNSNSPYNVASACSNGVCSVSTTATAANIPIAFFSMSQFYGTVSLFGQNASGAYTTQPGGVNINTKTMGQFSVSTTTISVDMVTPTQCYLSGQ